MNARPPALARTLPTLTLAAVLWAPAGPLIGQADFSIEDALSAPMPSALVAGPDGHRIAWVQEARGARNVWVAEAPDFEGRQVTSRTEDDGQAVGELAFIADGSAVVFVRGGAPNRQGEMPNPTSHPEGAERAVWIVPFEDGDARRLAEGHAPAPAPRGSTVAFRRGDALWTVDARGDDEARLLAEVRGGPSSLRWSPDGERLAFVSSRGDHAFVGIVDADGGALRYLDPSVDRDASPVWSPGGDRIAFLRIPSERDVLPFTPKREGLPWSIRVVNLDTGEARRVWRASEGTGSVFHGIDASSQLFWGAGDRLVFPWEGSGWVQLYSVPVSGGEARPLMSGDFEVQFAALSRDRGSVVYDSNKDDIDRKHLWRVPVDGSSAPRSLTRGRGVEWSPVPLAGEEAVAFMASAGTIPAHVEVLSDGERRWTARSSLPPRFPSGALVEPRQVVFPAADGLEIHGQLFVPPDARPGDGRPGVLFFHGGSRRQMLLGFHHRGYYHNAYALNQYLASRGYVVLSVNYRSGIGYGMKFREALKYGARGASEFNDVLGAGVYLRNRPEVDPGRVGLWGGSYGGYLTALGLARASELFAAGVDVHGVHDWNEVIRNFVPTYDATEREEFARLAFESSPLADVDTWRSPVLLIHGDDDRNVPFSESVHLAESLRRQGVEFEELIFPDEVHGFLLHRNWIAAYRATADFFRRTLENAR